MARLKAGEIGFYIALPVEEAERIKALADRNGRPLKDEVLHAFRRHLAEPPVITVVVTEKTPKMSPAILEVQPPKTPRKK